MEDKIFNDNKTIKSSEIGQHEYCSVAWYLRRCGYKPSSKALDKGLKAHADLGNKITSALGYEKTSRSALYLGLGLLAVVIILLGWFFL